MEALNRAYRELKDRLWEIEQAQALSKGATQMLCPCKGT